MDLAGLWWKCWPGTRPTSEPLVGPSRDLDRLDRASPTEKAVGCGTESGSIDIMIRESQQTATMGFRPVVCGHCFFGAGSGRDSGLDSGSCLEKKERACWSRAANGPNERKPRKPRKEAISFFRFFWCHANQ